MKKAQAAMDFIMTYGWAILSVFAVIGILAYFGILSPEKYMEDDCVFLQPGFECMGHKVEPGSITLVVHNAKNSNVSIKSVSLSDCKMEQTYLIPPNSNLEMQFRGCALGDKDSRFKEELEVEYVESENGFSRFSVLEVNSRIE